MTHEPEASFHDRAVAFLEAEYGSHNVEENVYMEHTGRYADIVVSLRPVTLAIEVENDFEAAVKGVGQALLYSEEPATVGAVVLPPGHVDEPERTILSRTVPVLELDV